MLTQPFLESLPFVLRWEGGFVDDPDDPGDRTNKGVTQKTYAAWRSRRGLPPADVKDMLEQLPVRSIYKQEILSCLIMCDELTKQIDIFELQIRAKAKEDEDTKLLMTIPGGRRLGRITRELASFYTVSPRSR